VKYNPSYTTGNWPVFNILVGWNNDISKIGNNNTNMFIYKVINNGYIGFRFISICDNNVSIKCII
jgi:hypothetical protein